MPGERPETRERQRRHSTDAYSEPSFSRQCSHENVEVIPTRMTKVAASKPAANPLQFVKVGPCDLYLSAQEQLKKVEEVKKVKKEVRDEAEDWQSNLDNWKCSRRKRQEHIIERVVEVKKLELEEHDRNRRRSKTFSQMMEERGSRGRKLSLPLYQDDDSNNLSDLGLGGGASTSNTEDSATEGSLNGDDSQKETSENDVSSRNYKQNGNGLNCHKDDAISNAASSPEPEEYTYDRAIQNYVNFTETRVKSCLTRSEVSTKTNGFTKKSPFVPPKPRRESSARIEEKLSALEKLERRSVSTSDLSHRDPNRKPIGVPKVDILKRRLLFEKTDSEEQTLKSNRLSGDFSPTKSIRERLSSLEKQVEDTTTSLKKLSRLSGELSVKDRLSNIEKRGSIDNITASTIENKRYSDGEFSLSQSVKDRLSTIEKMNVDEAVKLKTSENHSEHLVEDRVKVNLDKRSYENTEHSLLEKSDPLKQNVSLSEQANNCGRPFSLVEDVYENTRQQHFRHRSLDSLDVDSTDGLGNDSFERVQSLEDLELCHNYPASSLSGDTDREDSGIHTADVSSSVSQADDCDLHLDNHSVDSDIKLHHQPTILEEMVKHNNVSADKVHNDWTDIKVRSTSVSEEPSSDCGGAAVMVMVDTSTQSVRVLEKPDSLSIASLPVIPEASTEPSTPCEVTYTFIPKSLCFNTVVNNYNQIEQDILHASLRVETSGLENYSVENYVNSEESLVNTGDEYCNAAVNDNSVNTMTQDTFETIDFVNRSSVGYNSCDSEAADSVAILTTPSTNTTLVVDGTGDIAEIGLQNSTSELNYDDAMQNNSSDISTNSLEAPLQSVSVPSCGLQPFPGSPEMDQHSRPAEVEPTNFRGEDFLQHFQTKLSSQQPFDAVDKRSPWNDAVSVVDPMIVSEPTYPLEGGVTDCPFVKVHAEDPFLHNQSPQLEPDVMLTLSPTSMLEPPKEKPPPPPTEISDGEDEITSSKSSLRRLDSTKRIKNEIRLKRSSFLGIERNNDDNYLEPELELVQPPPDMTTFLQEERRLEQQLYRQSICSESDSTQGESRDSGVELERSHQDLSWPQHARSDSEPFGASTTSEEEEIVKKEKEIIEMLEQEEQSRYTNNYSQDQHDIGEKLALRLRELEQEKSHLDWEQEEEEARRKAAEEVKRCEQENRIMAREQEIRKQEELLLEQQWASLQDVSLVSIQDCRRTMPHLQEPVQPPCRPPPPPLPAKPKPTAINNRTSSPQQMTRQTLQALSAVPRSRLISTDTWIQTKRTNKPKQEGCNYQHWLIQEAEHRRIMEQQQRQAVNLRRSVAPQTQWAPAMQHNSPEVSSGKPLPDSIIQTLTQRVQNRFNNPDANNNPKRRTDMSTVQEPRFQPPNPETHQEKMLSVSGKKKCSHCGEELGRGAAMIIESLRLFFHIDCFKCCVCCVQLGDGLMGTDVRVRNNKLHCHNCYSSDDGVKFSCV